MSTTQGSQGQSERQSFADATQLHDDLLAGRVKAQDILQQTLKRIESSSLGAATEILRTESQAQLSSLPKGPLYGLTASVKECYAIATKTIRSGSARMVPVRCSSDAAMVRALKDAGALVVARGNTSEFLMGRETDNLVYGKTNNAINPALTAGGSSGGDAALVASGCVSFGIGTDIGGSIRYPAAFNGIVGFKPASGQLPKEGAFPVADNEYCESMNSPGILARSVRDVRMVYNALQPTAAQAKELHSNVKICRSTNFKVRIKDASITSAMQMAETAFANAGISVGEMDCSDSATLYTLFVRLICSGFADAIVRLSKTSDGKKLSFFGEAFRRLGGKASISDELFAMLLPFQLMKPSAAKREKVIAEIETLRDRYRQLLGNNTVLMLPTVGVLAAPHKKFFPQYNKPGVIDIITPVSFCNVLNLSCITIPVWKARNSDLSSPPAIQLITAPGNEEALLNVAEFLERSLR